MQKHFVKLHSKVVTSVTPEVGKWHFRLVFMRDWTTTTGRQFQFGLFKLLKRPPIGEISTCMIENKGTLGNGI